MRRCPSRGHASRQPPIRSGRSWAWAAARWVAPGHPATRSRGPDRWPRRLRTCRPSCHTAAGAKRLPTLAVSRPRPARRRRMDRLTGTVRALVAALVMCAASGLPAAAQPGVQIIDAFDIGFDPTEITVPAPGAYSFAIENSGAILHDLTFPDGQVAAADPGEQSETLSVDVPAEGLAYWCSVPGHREAGMEGFISVAGAPVADGPVPGVAPDPNV